MTIIIIFDIHCARHVCTSLFAAGLTETNSALLLQMLSTVDSFVARSISTSLLVPLFVQIWRRVLALHVVDTVTTMIMSQCASRAMQAICISNESRTTDHTYNQYICLLAAIIIDCMIVLIDVIIHNWADVAATCMCIMIVEMISLFWNCCAVGSSSHACDSRSFVSPLLLLHY